MIKLCGLHSEFVSSLDCLLQMVGNLIKLNSICPALAVCDHVNVESSDSPYEREIFKPKPTQANNLFICLISTQVRSSGTVDLYIFVHYILVIPQVNGVYYSAYALIITSSVCNITCYC